MSSKDMKIGRTMIPKVFDISWCSFGGWRRAKLFALASGDEEILDARDWARANWQILWIVGVVEIAAPLLVLQARRFFLVEVEIIKRYDDKGVGDPPIGDGALHVG